jgi:hypothetical protein
VPLSRRRFLAFALAAFGVLATRKAWAHHKPGHHGGLPTTATTSTTLPEPDPSRWGDAWTETW